TVTDHQLTLSTSNRNHGINGLYPCLKWFVHGLSINYTWCFALQGHLVSFANNGSFSIDRGSQCIYHTANNSFTYIDGCNAFCSLYRSAFHNLFGWAQQYDTYVVFFQVQDNALHAAIELHQLTILCIGKSIDTGNTVTYL